MIPAWSSEETRCSLSWLLSFVWAQDAAACFAWTNSPPFPSPALPFTGEQKHRQHQHKLPTNQGRLQHEHTLIFLQVGCWKFPVLQSMFLADQNKQSLDFLLKAESFATALFVPTLLQLLHPLADPENSTCEMQHSLTPHPCGDEAERLLQGCHPSAVLSSPPTLKAVRLSSLYYQAELLKERGSSSPQEEHLHLPLKRVWPDLGRTTPTVLVLGRGNFLKSNIKLHLPTELSFKSFLWMFCLSLEHSSSESQYPALFSVLVSGSFSTSEALVPSQKTEVFINCFPVVSLSWPW